ncbi:MAG: RidA family protein [Candidatus Binatia bacterium]
MANIQHIQPPGLAEAQGYSHVVTATGGTTIFIAGQGAYNANNQLVGAGDHYAQTKQAYRNLCAALAGAGATPANIVKSTIYVVGLTDAVLADFSKAMNEGWDGQPMPPTAATLVGVERLAYQDMLIEIDAIAVI